MRLSCPRACSGGMYDGVPSASPVSDRSLSRTCAQTEIRHLGHQTGERGA